MLTIFLAWLRDRLRSPKKAVTGVNFEPVPYGFEIDWFVTIDKQSGVVAVVPRRVSNFVPEVHHVG